MKGYVLKRTAWAVVATFVIVTITFVLMYITPDPQLAQVQFSAAQSGGDSSQAVEAYKQSRGLDKSFHEQYVNFVGNIFTGNWGWSHYRSQPVTEALVQAMPYSMMYGIPALFLSTVAGVIIGLYSATHQYTKTDYLATLFAFTGISIPNFWFAIILLLVFGSWLGWIPILFDPNLAKVNGEFALGAIFSWPNVRQLILPILVLATGAIASLMRYARAEALEYVEAEFVKTAKSKGVDDRRILYKHIFRPASIPLATILVGDILGIVFVGSYLIEVVFGIPGLGTLSYRAIVNQDPALVMGTVFVPTFIAIVGNLAQDVAYTILDPRIDYDDR